MSSHRSRVLVIDDDPLFRSLITSLLQKDFIVSTAGEGAEGLYKALEHPPDIVLIDIQMPGWDGLTTLKAFRSHSALQHVKAVILTSDASRGTVLAAVREGADDYVVKPTFSREEFRQKLHDLVAGQPRGENWAAEVADRQGGALAAAGSVASETALPANL